MHFAFIIDPLASLKQYKDSSIAMLRAAQARGHRISVFEAGELYVDGAVRARCQQLTVAPGADWYRIAGDSDLALHEFDAVVMRKDPPFDADYLTATHLLSAAEREGARVVNRPQALRDCNEKLTILQFSQFTAPTLVSRDMARLRAFVLQHGDVILKPLDGMGGAGIFRLTPGDPNLGAILETQSRHGQHTLMIQRYLPAIQDGDKRVLLIDGQPVDWCLARIPQDGETRGNLAAGGRGEARPLTARDREIAEHIGPWAREQGLLLVGLDIIGDTLTEVNVTSPTCMVEISAQAGIDVPGLFIDALERRCRC